MSRGYARNRPKKPLSNEKMRADFRKQATEKTKPAQGPVL